MSNITYWKDFKKELIQETPHLKLEFDVIDLKIKLIKKIKEYLENNNLTQQDLADKLGVKQQVISRFFKGEINPRLDFILKILILLEANITIPKNEIIKKEKFKISTIKNNNFIFGDEIGQPEKAVNFSYFNKGVFKYESKKLYN